MGMWDGFLRKGRHSFGHCPNYLPRPPSLPPFQGACTTFFWHRNSRFESQFRTKNTIYIHYYILYIYNLKTTFLISNYWHFGGNRLHLLTSPVQFLCSLTEGHQELSRITLYWHSTTKYQPLLYQTDMTQYTAWSSRNAQLSQLDLVTKTGSLVRKYFTCSIFGLSSSRVWCQTDPDWKW